MDFLLNLYKGRLNRRNYILGLISALVLYFGGVYVLTLIEKPPFDGATLFVSAVLLIAVLFFNVSLHVRRFHDQNNTGWTTLVFLVPIINIIFLFILLMKKGTNGKNNYGIEPAKEIHFPKDMLNLTK